MYRRNSVLLKLLLCLILLCSGSLFAADHSSLQAFVDSLLSQKSLSGSSWSLRFYDPEQNQVIIEHDADRLLIPASVVKMVTSATAIDRLGPDYRFETRFYTSTPLSAEGQLNGDLIVYAGGDPSMETKVVDSLRTTWTGNIADNLFAQGLREINGDLRLATNAYKLECAPSAWEIGDVKEGFAPAVDGFGYNDNVCRLSIFPGASVGAFARLAIDPPYAPLDIHSSILTGERNAENWVDYYITPCHNEITMTGVIAAGDDGEFMWMPVQEPAAYFGEALKASLIKRGIAVSGEIVVDRNGLSEKSFPAPFYKHHSAPLTVTLSLMNKASDNYSAEYVLRAVGKERTGSGSAESGLKAVRAFLNRNGIEPRHIKLVDGCGLARRDLCSAQGLTELLTVMHHHQYGGAFKYTLAHSGIDGTLDYRMASSKLAGRVRAKTGTLTFASSLAGYLTLESGKEIIFAILCNNYSTSRHHVRGIQDQIIERVFDEYSNESSLN
jgi:PBP4 family serine-type D-alanyl-D-alanine carboxypeptidase